MNSLFFLYISGIKDIKLKHKLIFLIILKLMIVYDIIYYSFDIFFNIIRKKNIQK
jgi:hypothetical protein